MNNLTAAERIEDIMRERGGSVTGDAQKMGISQCTLSDFLNGKRKNITIDTLKKMCEYYDVSADYILGLTETKSKDKGIQAICNSTMITEKAATTLSSLNSPTAITFINAVLESDLVSIDRIGKKLCAYQITKNVIEPNVEMNKERLKGKKLTVNVEVNGENLPNVPLQDVNDYARFELLRVFLELVDEAIK